MAGREIRLKGDEVLRKKMQRGKNKSHLKLLHYGDDN